MSEGDNANAPTSAQYRLTIRVRLDDAHSELLGDVTSAIAGAGGTVGAIDLSMAPMGMAIQASRPRHV